MAQLCKQEVSVVTNAPAAQVHDIFLNKIYLLPKVSPEIVKAVDLVEGEWGKQGSVMVSSFLHGGQASSCKSMIESIDETNKVVVYKAVEGELMMLYKSFKFIFQANGNMVKWSLEYEKNNSDVPEPDSFMDLALSLTKAIDASLTLA